MTEKRSPEHALAAALLDALPVGILQIDPAGVIRTWSAGAEEITGLRRDEVVGRPATEIEAELCLESSESEPVEGRPGVARRRCRIRTEPRGRVELLRTSRDLPGRDDEPAGLLVTLTDVTELTRLRQEVAALRSSLDGRHRLEDMVGKSAAMRQVFDRILLAAETSTTTLITGESGTGKELVAAAIHGQSARSSGPFVKVHAAALPETLLESELFGHTRGAFTGATRDKIGRFEAANGGTLFLDELGDLSPLTQLKLLRVVEERAIERLGENRTRRVDVRLIAATHRDLKKLVAEGRFREDLYYRIHVFAIDLPPLRDRREDVPLLVDHFVDLLGARTGKRLRGVSPGAMRCLIEHDWPGNVRELENAVEHGLVTAREDVISLFDLPVEVRRRHLDRAADEEDRDERMRQEILEALDRTGGHRERAATMLGISRVTLWKRMKKLGLSD
jgi:two-component system response regulator HydG